MKSRLFVFFLFLASCDNSGGERAMTNSETTLRKYMRDMRFNVTSLSCRIVRRKSNGDSVCDLDFRYCQVTYIDSSNTTRNSNFCCNVYNQDSNRGCYMIRD